MDDEVIKYCLDTNIVSDILRDNKDAMQCLDNVMARECEVFIPSVVYYEITRGYLLTKSFRRIERFLAIFNSFERLPCEMGDVRTLDQAAKIYNELHCGKQIEDNDIYIAALAMINDCVLVTDNWKHFGRIKGLKLVNWRNATISQ